MSDPHRADKPRPTRRAFVAMLGLGAALLATVKVRRGRDGGSKREPKRDTPPIWIGHY